MFTSRYCSLYLKLISICLNTVGILGVYNIAIIRLPLTLNYGVWVVDKILEPKMR